MQTNGKNCSQQIQNNNFLSILMSLDTRESCVGLPEK
jgi:hypothetical protein